jgi:hypothetical protein
MEPRQLLSAAAHPLRPATLRANTSSNETITLTPSTAYQTIQGWLGIASMEGTSAFQQAQALNMLVNDLGLTGLRLEAPAGNLVGQASWEATPAEDLPTFASTGAPANSSYSAFNTASTDTNVTDVVIPFQNLVNARQANAFTLYTTQSFYNFGGSGHIPTWMAGNPGEYAENLVSFDEYLKSKYGIVPTYMTILNEEDNQTHMTPALNAAIIRAVGPLLQKAGLSTKILAGETVTPTDVTPTAPAGSNYVSSLTPDDWRYIAGISYHNYGGASNVGAASAEAQSQGVFTSEDETTDGSALTMYNDLVNGDDSFSMPQYGLFGLGSSITPNTGSLLNGGIDQASIQPGESYFDFRQIMDYVRPGAVRIGASSGDSNIETMAFRNNGQVTTILINQLEGGYTPVAKTMTITGLPNGTYGVSASIGASANGAAGTPEELGVQTVTNGTLTVNDPANSVLTIYPRAAGVTLAPYIYQSSATAGSATYLLTGGATSISLKATADDPQLDRLSYSWSVASAPAGAAVSLVNAGSASATANGLTVAGQYIFNVVVSNGTASSTRQVGFNVFSGPQQPIVEIVENRSPPSGSVPASIGPILHLPSETSTQLWAQLAYDLQGDAVTGTWSYVSGPAGASPVLTNENISGLPAGYIASNLTVAGNYDFRLTATDGVTAPVVEDLIVTVDAPNPATSLTTSSASGSYVSPSNGQLKATVTDTNGGGQWTSSWWDVLSQPAGSNVTFTDQTSPNTKFTVDTAGQYQFQLYSVDQTLAATSGVVTVNIPSVAPSPLPAYITASSGAAYSYNSSTGALSLTSGTLTFTADNTAAPLINLTASGSGSKVIFNTNEHLAGITLTGGAQATVQSLGSARTHSNHNVLVIGALGSSSDPTFSVDSSSKLDLNDNDLIVHTGSSDSNGANEYATVQGLATTGRNPASGAPGNPDGQWNGNGLSSSAANAADAAAGYEKIGLAVVVNSTLAEPVSSWQVGSFNETLGANDIIVKYDYLGDYNLEGSVNADDAGILQIEYDNGKSKTHSWATGSSMGNGLADANEAGLFQIQYGLGTGGNLGPQL